MGEVWKAWDTALKRWVALKFLKGGDDEELARFAREAQTAGRLNHPNIAAVHEVGVAQERHYIAMQYVEGQTLKTFPRGDRRLCVRLARDAALAVQYAHEQGVVHRDLKPENLMVVSRVKPGTGRSEGGAPLERHHVYVMDFGLARTVEGEGVAVSGSVVGTPAYMPPEQTRGSRVDARADVYSLGATLYELLTDRAPFHGSSVYEVLAKVQGEEPAAPRGVDPGVDRDLETIVLKCLEKEAVLRYGSAQELAEDLDRWLAGEPVAARAPSAAYRARKFLVRHRAGSAAAALVLAVVAVSAVLVTAPGRERARRVGAALAEAAAREGAGDATAARDAYARALALDPAHADARVGVERMGRRLAEAAAEEQQRVAGAMTLLEQGRSALEDVSRYLYSREARYEELVRRVEKGQAAIEEGLRRAPELALGHHLLGRALEVRGLFEAADACWRRALERDAGFAPARFWRARTLLTRSFIRTTRKGALGSELPQEGRDEAEALAAEAARELEAASGFDDPMQQDFAAAMLAVVRGKGDEARGVILPAIEKYGSAPGVEEFHWLAAMGGGAGNPDEHLERALAIRPKHAFALYVRSTRKTRRGDRAGAIADCTEALGINPHFAAAYFHRGIMKQKTGDVAGAMADYDEAIRSDPKDPYPRQNRGNHRKSTGDIEGAMEDFTAAIEGEPTYFPAWIARCGLWTRKQQYDHAIADGTEGVRLSNGRFEAYLNRGVAYANSGDHARAESDFTEAINRTPSSGMAY